MSRARRRRSKKRRAAQLGPVSPGDGRLDLHLHTHLSDGRDSPEAVVQVAAERGLTTIALTDHDVPPALHAGDHHVGSRIIRVLHAAEVSGAHPARELHILAYFSGEMPAGFRAFLRGRAQARAERYDTALDALGADDVPRADAAARAGDRALTRHHLAQALIAAGHVGTLRAAFQGPLSRRSGAVPGIELAVSDVISTIRDHGGVPVWAHPPMAVAAAHLDELVDAGLLGVEVSRPSLSAPKQGELARMALERGLVTTGGSDWHGWQGRLGSFRVRRRAVAPFLDLLDVPAPVASHG